MAMSAEPKHEPIICNNCGTAGHNRGDCAVPRTVCKTNNNPSGEKKNGSRGGAGLKWRTVHNTTTTQSDAECYVQGAPRSQTGRARTATAVLSAQTSPDDSGMKSAVGFGEIMNRDDDLNQNLILA